MKKGFLLLIALLGMLVPTKGQLVNYGDSNYMAVIYDPDPPLNSTGNGLSTIIALDNYAPIFNPYDPYPSLQWAKIFAMDSVERISGIAFTADSVILEKGGD